MESPAAALPARPQAFQLTQRIGPYGVWLLGFLFVSFVAGSAGGFRATTWAWTALLSWWIAVIVLIVKRRLALGLLELTTIAGVLAFTGWFALSAVWSQSVPSTLDATIRYVAYSGVVVATLLIVERGTVPHLVGGVTTGIGILALYALGTRVLPDRLGDFSSTSIDTYRLSVPITYWNGLGIFCAIGLLLALGFAIRGNWMPTRALAAASMPVLMCSLYFTFSRGAWLSLLIGLAAALVLDPHRLQLAFGTALIGFPSGLAVVVASRMDGLTTPRTSLAEATHDGHRFVPLLLVLAAISAGTAVGLALVDRRVDVPRSARIAWATALIAALVIGTGAALVAYGSPVHMAQRAWNQASTQAEPNLTESTPNQRGNNARLFELGLSGRFAFWRASLDAFREHPVAGTGGETFWQVWAASPRQSYSTVEPHSVYLGTLAELGVVGLALLLVALLPPLGAALRSRGSPLIPLVLAAYVAWIVHSGIDWDWTLMGVSGPGLLCGVALLAGGRGEARARRPILLATAAVTAAAMGLFALTSVVANDRLSSANAAITAGRDESAVAAARGARRFAPWSVEALELIAAARLDQGQRDEALEAYRKAVARDPNSWLAWTQLASVAMGAERRNAAAVALRLNPLAPRV